MRLHFLIIAISLFLLSGSNAGEKPNVLFIAIDDLRPELGCYGHDYVTSPNLDQLAASGVLFTRHQVQVPTCGASRYALLTGRSPRHSGVTASNAGLYSGKSALKPQSQPGAQTMPELFRRAGYRTVCIGKISHTADGKVYAYDGSGDGRDELPNAWDELATPYGSWKRGWGIFFAYEGGRSREDGQGNRDLMEFTAEHDRDLPDGLMTEHAIAKLGELKKSDQPFFLGLGLFKPHLPFVAPRQDWEAMKDVAVPPPANPEKPDSPYWHASGEFHRYDFPFPKKRPLPEADAIQTRRAYLACVRYVDRQVGKVLAALDRLDLAENTIVVVWGDHGWHLGESQIWGKHTPFERAVHSALIIRAPGMTPRRCDSPVETLDIYPTLVDLCEPTFRKTQHPLDGVSLQPILTGERSSVRETAVSYWRNAVSVRSSEHRLIAKLNNGKLTDIELYDVTETPDPVENIAANHPDIVERLSRFIQTPTP